MDANTLWFKNEADFSLTFPPSFTLPDTAPITGRNKQMSHTVWVNNDFTSLHFYVNYIFDKAKKRKLQKVTIFTIRAWTVQCIYILISIFIPQWFLVLDKHITTLSYFTPRLVTENEVFI